MIYLISLGLYDKEDMSFRAFNAAKSCGKLYFERYTSYYNTSTKELEQFLGKKIIEVTRQELEDFDKILSEAKNMDVGVLVVGDALSATTHSALFLDAHKEGIKFRVIHGSSVFTAVAETGLSLYKFGKVTSIPFLNKDIEEPYNVIKNNKDMHTLVLLDLDPQQDKYMSVNEAINYLLSLGKSKKDSVFTDDTLVVAIAALGGGVEIKYGKVKDLKKIKLGGTPQCLVVVGKLHFMEENYLSIFRVSNH